MAGRAKLAAEVGALTLGGLATAGPLLAIIIAVALVVVATLIVVIATSDKMSSNVVRILAVVLGRPQPLPPGSEALATVLGPTPGPAPPAVPVAPAATPASGWRPLGRLARLLRREPRREKRRSGGHDGDRHTDGTARRRHARAVRPAGGGLRP
jgi:hypothetical protein